MATIRSWWRLLKAAPAWWQRLLIVVLTAGGLWLAWIALLQAAALVIGGAESLWSAAARFGRLVLARLTEALPLIAILILLSYAMGRPGRILRKGFIELISNILIGVFALLGVQVTKDKKREHRKEEDEDD